MNRVSLPALLALTLALGAPAFADAWTDALSAELIDRDPKEAIKRYTAIRKAGKERAKEAGLRVLALQAKANKPKEVKAAAEALAKAFPKLKKRMDGIAAKPEKYIASTGAGLKKLMATRQLSLSMDGTPLSEAIDMLRDVSGINFVLLPDVNDQTLVTVNLKNISLEKALKLMLAADGDLESKVFQGTVLIGKALSTVKRHKWTKVEIEANPEAVFTLISRPVTLAFPSAETSTVAKFLGEISGLKIRLDKSVQDADPKVSLRLRKVPMATALALVLGPHGFEFVVDQLGVRFRAQP